MTPDTFLVIDGRRTATAVQAGMIQVDGRQMECRSLSATYKLVFVRDGRLGLERDGNWFDVGAGEALVLTEEERSRVAIAYPPDLTYYWIAFEVVEGTVPLASPVELPRQTRVSRKQRLVDLLHFFIEDQESDELDTVRGDLMLMQILAEVAASRESRPATADELLARRVQDFIDAHFTEPIRTSAIAEALDVSADHLSRVYRRVTGRTPTEGVVNARIREARLRLIDGSQTISEIARACGFRDADYFRRVFRREEAMAPSEFRAAAASDIAVPASK